MKKSLSLQFLAVLALNLLVVPAPSWACGAGAPLFVDDFTQPDSGWVPAGPQNQIGDGKLLLTPVANGMWRKFNVTHIYANADVCVNVSAGSYSSADDKIAAGLLFWAQSDEVNYAFDITPDGYWGIFNHSHDNPMVALARGRSSAIRTGPRAENELEVRLDGTNVQAYINGTRVATLSAQPPLGGGPFGVYAASEGTAPTTWTFSHFQIRQLQ